MAAAGQVTLPALTVAGEIVAATHASGVITLQPLTVLGDSNRTNRLLGDVQLGLLSLKGYIQRTVHTMHGAVRLGVPRGRGLVRNDVLIFSLTGTCHRYGSAIFCFLGPPSRVIEWSIEEGAGVLLPYTPDVTDQWGRGFCLYHAGGYAGPLTVRVSYGA